MVDFSLKYFVPAAAFVTYNLGIQRTIITAGTTVGLYGLYNFYNIPIVTSFADHITAGRFTENKYHPIGLLITGAVIAYGIYNEDLLKAPKDIISLVSSRIKSSQSLSKSSDYNSVKDYHAYTPKFNQDHSNNESNKLPSIFYNDYFKASLVSAAASIMPVSLYAALKICINENNIFIKTILPHIAINSVSYINTASSIINDNTPLTDKIKSLIKAGVHSYVGSLVDYVFSSEIHPYLGKFLGAASYGFNSQGVDDGFKLIGDYFNSSESE